MIIAIPLNAGKLSPHFGHCEQFGLFQVENKRIVARTAIVPPPHEPGLLPRWLKEKGVNLVIVGGMGRRAQDLFTSSGVKVICGVNQQDPEEIVDQHLNGTLETGNNICDH
jgi:ATP-binding protein involved in chromosome partitioning